jgi:hypothetical protein
MKSGSGTALTLIVWLTSYFPPVKETPGARA